jgi:hypothetical protein
MPFRGFIIYIICEDFVQKVMLAARDVSCNGDNVSLPGSLDLSLFPYSAH